MMVRRYGSQSAASLAAEADRDQSTADRYAKMLALATELGLEYEVERMGAAVAEYEDSAEALRERALLAGYNPDDYATVGPNEAARLASRSGEQG